jgi:hypothetical protein
MAGMVTQDDVRRLALSLPGVREGTDRFGFSVEVKGKAKGIAWVWNERVVPKKPKVPNPGVLAIRVADQDEKAALLAGAPEKIFTEPHYNGYPAVLVRLAKVTKTELRQLLVAAWECTAPRELLGEKPASPRRPRAPTARGPSPAPARRAARSRSSRRAPGRGGSS